MSRILSCASLLALLVVVLASVQSAAPPRPVDPATKAVRALPLVDRMYAEIDFPGLDNPKMTLLDALDFLWKEYGVTFDIREGGFKYEMLNEVVKVCPFESVPLRPMKARLGDVLQRILDRILIPSGATWLLREKHVEVTTGLFAEHDAKAKPYLEMDEDAPASVYTVIPVVSADFRNKPLAEALGELTRRTSENIVLDQGVVKDRGDRKVTARLRNVHVDTAVLLLASQADLGMAKLDNVYYVTTEEKATKLTKRHAELRAVPSKKSPKKEQPPPKDPLLFKGVGGSGIPKKK